MRILNVESELFHSFTDQDNIQYDLFVSTEDNKGMVRIRDLDANETVSLKKYPSVKEAEQAYNKLIRQVKASVKKAKEINYPGHGWSPEQKVNRHLYPAFKKIEDLLFEIKSFFSKYMPSADFGGNAALRKEVYTLLSEVLKNTEDLFKLFKQYKSQKVASLIKDIRKILKKKAHFAYLSILAKSFNPDHNKKMGEILNLTNEIWNILLNARTLIPPERYQESKELISNMSQNIKKLLDLINKN